MNDSVDGVLFQVQPLARAMRALVEAGGSLPAEAELVAQNLVLANASGHDSHGVGMLPRYVQSLSDGGLSINQHAQIVLDTGTLLRLDGGAGYGQVVGKEAMESGEQAPHRPNGG